MNISPAGASPLPGVRPTGAKGRPESPVVDIPTDPPGQDKPKGLVGAAAHSHGSDVAALRRWINHPDLRDQLPLPDVTAEHQGKGFSKAVAAYEAAAVLVDPPVVTDPPVVEEPPAATV